MISRTHRRVLYFSVLTLMNWVTMDVAYAIRDSVLSGDDAGAVAVYSFENIVNNGTVSVPDVGGNGAPLNLIGSSAGNIQDGAFTNVVRVKADPYPLPGNSNVFMGVSIDSPFRDFSAIFMNNKETQGETPGYQRAQMDRSFLWSNGPATKINEQCRSNFTIQAFVRPQFAFHGDRQVGTETIADGGGPQRLGNTIVALTNSGLGMASSSTGGSATNPSNFDPRTGARLATPNFGIYQVFGQDEQARILFRMRTANSAGTVRALDVMSTGAWASTSPTDNIGALNEIIATWNSVEKKISLYLNRSPVHYTISGTFVPSFTDFAHLVMGNDLVYLDPTYAGNPGQRENYVRHQRNWSGEIHHVAIYCNSFSEQQIMGGERYSFKLKEAPVKPDLSRRVTPEQMQARKMASRLAGVRVPVDHPLVLQMAEKLKAGDRIGAAKIITGDKAAGLPGHPQFLNVTVRNMGLPMSNRDETVRAPLNDFVASMIGVTRDETNAKELLTGDFMYLADPTKSIVPSNLKAHLYETNYHYDTLGDPKNNWDVGRVLRRVDAQNPITTNSGFVLKGQFIVRDSAGTLMDHVDPAGVLTSRAFMSEHAIAGTNRRLVEYTMKSFMCLGMSDIADTSASILRIGRDVERAPGGDNSKFETSCKGCHTVMDGFRGAFARVHFTLTDSGLGVFKHTQVHASSNENMSSDPYRFDRTGAASNPNGVIRKMNHNEDNFPSGYELTDESFVNNAFRQQSLFNWRGEFARGGSGMHQFGQMIADSKRFSYCMAQRVYETVCIPGNYNKKKVAPMLTQYADRFEASGYKVRNLFQEIAANTSCIKMDGGR